MSDFIRYSKLVYALCFSLIVGCFILLIYIAINLNGSKYCYIDNNNNLGTSFYCRGFKCSSSDMDSIYVKDFILLKGGE